MDTIFKTKIKEMDKFDKTWFGTASMIEHGYSRWEAMTDSQMCKYLDHKKNANLTDEEFFMFCLFMGEMEGERNDYY